MSPARKHRESILAALSTAVVPALASGLAPASEPAEATPADASPARRHRDTADTAPIAAPDQVVLLVSDSSADAMARQIALRLVHDQRRLKQIQSLEAKVAAKREMLPEYAAWISGVIEADAPILDGPAAPIVPTIMVWHIDIGSFDVALQLAEHVLRHKVPLPAQYQRQPATLIVEETAEAALKAQLADAPFGLVVLEKVDALTGNHDMPDEVRAKLCKAIGFELARRGEANQIDLTKRRLFERALVALKRAQQLHDRVGAKDRIKKVEKALAALGSTDNAGAAG